MAWKMYKVCPAPPDCRGRPSGGCWVLVPALLIEDDEGDVPDFERALRESGGTAFRFLAEDDSEEIQLRIGYRARQRRL